ncbi:MAG: hypothetical protein AAGI46_16220 [Planctomycetota bacterium]
MSLDPAILQRLIYTIGIPGGIGLLISVIVLLCRWPGVARWTIGVAGAAGLGLAFWQPFHEMPEPSSLGRWSQWSWMVPATAGVVLAWPALLHVPRKAWALPVAVVGLAGVMFFLAPARYAETLGQPLIYIFIVPLATALLVGPIWWAARRDDAGTADLASMTIIGVAAIPVLGLTGFHGATMLFFPVVAVTGAAWLASLVLAREGNEAAAKQLAVGCFILPIAFMPAAMVAWYAQPGLQKYDAVALALPAIAGLLAIVVPRLPRRFAGTVIAAGVAGLALPTMLIGSDARPYLPVVLSDAQEAWLTNWSEPPVLEETEASEADLNFWGGGGGG